MEGSLWAYVYCGFFDRMDPEGTVWPGLKSIDAIIGRLREAADRLDDPAMPLAGWSLDAIYYGGRRVNRHDLDRVSTERAVGVLNASGHILTSTAKRWSWPACSSRKSTIPASRWARTASRPAR